MMDPQKRTEQGKNPTMEVQSLKPDEKTMPSELGQTVKVAVAPKSNSSLDQNKPKENQKRIETMTMGTTEDLGARALPAGFFVPAFTALVLAAVGVFMCSLGELALLGATLSLLAIYRHICVQLERPGLPSRQPSFLTSKVKKYRLEVVISLLLTILLLWVLSLPNGRSIMAALVAGRMALELWLGPYSFPHPLIGHFGAAVSGIVVFFVLSPFWIRTSFGLVLAYSLFIKQNNRITPGRMWMNTRWNVPGGPEPDTTGLPAVYFLYVLGSGGHTAEMIETIKKQFQGQHNQHRRYVITSGDKDSLNHAVRLETLINHAYPTGRAGTFDTFTIPRARKVHQPLLTSPFTCLMTAAQALAALTLHPNVRSHKHYGHQFKWPHVVVTNGPATGFIVCLVAHVLKLFSLVPPNCLKLVYIESWARTRSLSLTGKLFLWTGIADIFCVQHEALAKKTGTEFIGLVKAKPMPFG